jgi:hypothetical protein
MVPVSSAGGSRRHRARNPSRAPPPPASQPDTRPPGGWERQTGHGGPQARSAWWRPPDGEPSPCSGLVPTAPSGREAADAVKDSTGGHHDHFSATPGNAGCRIGGPPIRALDLAAASSGPARRASRRSVFGHARGCLRRPGAPAGCRGPAPAGRRSPVAERHQPAGHGTVRGAKPDCGPVPVGRLTAGSGIRLHRAALRYPAGSHGLSGIRLQQR